jgi:hypothetical protein
MRRQKLGAFTVHGFRSSFRDWAGEEAHFPREGCEAALAHAVGGVEGEYRRGDALVEEGCLGALACDAARLCGAKSPGSHGKTLHMDL